MQKLSQSKSNHTKPNQTKLGHSFRDSRGEYLLNAYAYHVPDDFLIIGHEGMNVWSLHFRNVDIDK